MSCGNTQASPLAQARGSNILLIKREHYGIKVSEAELQGMSDNLISSLP